MTLVSAPSQSTVAPVDCLPLSSMIETMAANSPSSPIPPHARHIYASLLRMFRRELNESVRPELQSAYPLYVVDVMGEMFSHLEDWIAGQDYADVDAQRAALLQGAADGDAAGGLTADLDDFHATDGKVEAAFETVRALGNATDTRRMVHDIAASFDTLYGTETARQQASVETLDTLLARIDWDLTPELVERFALEKLGKAEKVSKVTKIPGGNSKDTFLIAFADGSEWIVRRDFPFGPAETSAPDEFGLLQTLADRGFPVPRPIAAEKDPKYFGQPFLVVERVAGVNGDDGAKIDPEVGRVASLELARLMAELHAIDPADLGLPVAEGSAADTVRAYVASWKDWWHANRLHPNALVTAGFAWLEDNVPEQIARVVPVHGDPRPGNMLMDGRTVTTLLDWEFVHAGDPSEDIQYAKGFIERYISWEEFQQAYRDAGGAPVSDAGERFYDVFRSLRNVVCCDVSWSGFVTGKYPAFKLASQGVIYKRMLGRHLATSLAGLTA